MSIDSIGDLAAAVRGRRTDLELSQAELAKRAGVSRKWVYEFEAGKPGAELAFVLRVLDTLDLVLELKTSSASPAETLQAVDLDAILHEYRGR